MNAIIISIGDELANGQTVDTNSAYLSRELAARGIPAVMHITVGDDQAAIARVLTDAARQVPLVIVTGGLGPTADDLTRQGLAQAMGNVALRLDEPSLAAIAERFRRMNRVMVDANRVQALVPVGADALPNEAGTAPGLHARLGGADVYVMPGVPGEMRWMFHHVIAPRLGVCEGVRLHRILHTFGEGESNIGVLIEDLMRRGNNPTVGTTVAAGLVSVRVVTCSDTLEHARDESECVMCELRRRLGDLVVGEDDQTLATVVGRLLRDAGQTLATAESCTGGLMGELITSVSGSSAYYLGGVVSYANAVKESLLGVETATLIEHGAVSEATARAMADGVRRRLGSDWGVSITGIAGPGGGTATKPVGLVWLAVSGPNGVGAWKLNTHGPRDLIRLRAALAAMNYLRLALQHRGCG
ncbi:MAG: competence/damage-inducible protein A [Phycisphaerae bacterium]|nr:competence/damage-inducible protein A [Phycisphaerae bacterium]